MREFTTKPGDTVLYSKFGLGATEVEVDGKEFILIREVRVVARMPSQSSLSCDGASFSLLSLPLVCHHMHRPVVEPFINSD